MKQIFSLTLAFILVPCLTMKLSAQELEQLISSKFEVIDEQDHQFIDCNTYRFGDEILYDNPNIVRLYENGAYRFDINFSYFTDNEIINPSNYLDKFYSVQIPASSRNNYRVTGISPKGDNLSIYAIATGDPGNQDTFRIQLLNKEAELLADAIYPFQVREDTPGGMETSFFPMKLEYKPIYVRLEDVNNPNNKIERQLLPFSPDTINLDAKKAFNFFTEIEEDVQIGGKSYVLVADHEKNYGYQVRLKWEGKSLRDKPNSKNGLRSYLTTVPGKNQPSVFPTLDLTAIMAADLKKAGLDQTGKRIQQQYLFVEPNTKLSKVYQGNYIKQHPSVIRDRADQKSTQYLINKYHKVIDNSFKKANQQVLKYYQVSPKQKMDLQKATITKDQKTIKPATTKPAITAKPTKQKYKIIQNQVNINKAPAKKATKATISPDQRIKTDAVKRNRPMVITPPSSKPPVKNGNYYTLAIEVSRETEVMSHRTYLLTFRIIN